MIATPSPPVQLARAVSLGLRRRIHFPREDVGTVSPGPGDEFLVFRKMTLDPEENEPTAPGAYSTVRFRFARFSPQTNVRLSLIPVAFIVAQPGFRSKTWMLGRDTGLFQGVYEWVSVADAEAYWTSFPMRLMKRRAIAGSVSYEITTVSPAGVG